ncbi:DUF3164 family protein [Martelella mediterranea]|uniref:Uncharacterized protein DUF3164 n=1 Tax=Martelella mediterranea TaxID=293089 RepID=A0A4R3NPC0_9HYPH|nr:DUF3164 family protein [Martelella mediterranea]TCT37451.1 uncharacterized protein DUF3164 [Martelella mediterranea]
MKHNIETELPIEKINGVDYVALAKGDMKPLSAIKPEDIEEDEMVRRLSAKAARMNEKLAAFREEIFTEALAMRELLAEKYGVKKGGKKGNITFSTVDTSLRLSIKVGETLTFGPALEVAKEVIDGCIRRWSVGSNDNIRALVDQAFQVDKAGKINTDRILGLRRLKIEDDTGEWQKAMDIISDSVRVMASKEYANFYCTDKENGSDRRVALDLANA